MNETPRRSRTALVTLLLGAAVWVVSCENPLAPELCATIPDQTIVVGETTDVALCFRDPNGEALDFDAFSSDPDIATVEIRGSTVTFIFGWIVSHTITTLYVTRDIHVPSFHPSSRTGTQWVSEDLPGPPDARPDGSVPRAGSL